MNGKQKSISFNIPKRKSVVRIIVGFFSSYTSYTYAEILAKQTVTKVSKELSASSKYYPSARDSCQRDEARVCSLVCNFHSAACCLRLVHIFIVFILQDQLIIYTFTIFLPIPTVFYEMLITVSREKAVEI